ncbi:phosphatase PAP2 family protein [Allorhodopirellula solitaria]|uniref:PAP2 superfamily protein n=1 Tax=Allorhodopirellula solitaria TaxID=2527987 RepID=A0A5C5XW90_9BACT|nr:phosphatase PAP2 family protein [Allorhodopirellula solitaria]TWT67180.1 PAP2 superfamily protein [Allorhodopirellula solitaria]
MNHQPSIERRFLLSPSQRLVSAGVLLMLGILLGAASIAVQGPLPGDVAATRFLQSVLGPEPAWAGPITQSAKHPYVWGMLAVGCLLAWIRAGWRGPTAVIGVFAAVKVLDFALRATIYTPKPIEEFVAVASASESSGFPSSFGLVYAALFGSVIFAVSSARNWQSNVAIVISIFMITVGSISRIVLGGHWTSQLLASLCIGFSFVIFATYLLNRSGQTPGEQLAKQSPEHP